MVEQFFSVKIQGGNLSYVRGSSEGAPATFIAAGPDEPLALNLAAELLDSFARQCRKKARELEGAA